MTEECVVYLFGGSMLFVAEPYDALREKLETARLLEKNQGERRVCPMVNVETVIAPDADDRWERHTQPGMIDPLAVVFMYRSPGPPNT